MAEIQPKIIGLMNTNLEDGRDLFDFLISNQEEVLLSYKSVRDRLIVTNKKLLVIDVQGDNWPQERVHGFTTILS